MAGLAPLDIDVARAIVQAHTARLVSAVERAGVFTPAECARIIARRDVLGFDQARVESRDRPQDRQVDEQVRQTERTHLVHGPEHAWIYDRLDRLVTEVNDATWQFKLSHMEPLQLLTYREGGHYGWHADLGVQGIMGLRKVSVTVQLSPQEDYDGGVLELQSGGRVLTPERPVGSAVLFPAWQPHRVTPVTRGVRHALVLWVVGKRSLR